MMTTDDCHCLNDDPHALDSVGLPDMVGYPPQELIDVTALVEAIKTVLALIFAVG